MIPRTSEESDAGRTRSSGGLSRNASRDAYDPDEIDLFFIADGDMTMYVIPSRALAGRVRVLLRTYRKYVAGNARGLLGEVACSDTSAPAGRAPALA